MGVKSTVRLSRRAAEERYVDLLIEKSRQRLRAQVFLLNNEQLEDTLERLNDQAHGGEGFENYLIGEE